MRRYYLYILILFFFTPALISCADEEKNPDEVEEDQLTDDKEEVEKIVNEFFDGLLAYDFKNCKNLATKSSYSSLSFLEKVLGEYQTVYFEGVTDCKIKDGVGICVCEFGYYGEETIEREVVVKQFEEEWLVEFVLGENFDNIFVYDYGYELNPRWEKIEKMNIPDEARIAFKDLLETLTSSDVKIGFSTSEDVRSVDNHYEGSAIYGKSEVEVNNFLITTTYDFEEDRLSSCYVSIDQLSTEVDMELYAESFGQLVADQLGMPFNVPSEFENELAKISQLRWFIKGYNEMLVLRFAGPYFSLTISEIP